MLRKRNNIIYAMNFMVQIVNSNIILGVSTRLPQSSLSESEREKLYDDNRGNTLALRWKGQKK